MTTRKNTTTIRIKRTTKANLEKIGLWGETHDELICKLLKEYYHTPEGMRILYIYGTEVDSE